MTTPTTLDSATAVERLTKIGKRIEAKDAKLTKEQIVSKALAEDPAAYDAIESERQALILRRGIANE